MSLVKDFLRLQTDMAVASGEIFKSRLSRHRLVNRAKHGNGQLVMLLPGYKATGRSMVYLRDFLNDCGFEAHTWGLGRNSGITDATTGEKYIERMIEQVIDRVRELAGSSRHKVALIGQSLGGLYARETAIRYPGEIDRVITLGSPTIHPYIEDDQNSIVVKLASNEEATGSRTAITGNQGFLHWGAREPALPCVAIWSPIDAVVFSQSAQIPEYIVAMSESPAIRENVRIVCSHAGMGFNEAVLLAITDRLVEPVNGWSQLDMQNYYPQWQISLVEHAFDNRLFHDMEASNWRENINPDWTPEDKSTAHNQGLIRQLVRDHNDFRRLKRLIEQLVTYGRFGSDTDLILLADVARFITDYLDNHHHPLEEFLVAQLAETHPPANRTLQRLSDEHQDIETAGEKLIKEIKRAQRSQKVTAPGRLLARWRQFCETLSAHIKIEEQELFPLFEERISEDIWPSIEQIWEEKHGYSVNPLSNTGQPASFRQLFEYLNYIASYKAKEKRAAPKLPEFMSPLSLAKKQINYVIKRLM